MYYTSPLTLYTPARIIHPAVALLGQLHETAARNVQFALIHSSSFAVVMLTRRQRNVKLCVLSAKYDNI